MAPPAVTDTDPSRKPCPTCPICEGVMELVYDRSNQNVFVCLDCRSGITVPASAAQVVQLKRENKFSRR